VESIAKNTIKFVRNLHKKSFRDEQNCFLVEGEKMVLEVLNTIPESVLFCITTDDFSAFSNTNVLFYRSTTDVLARCSTQKTPNKILAVVKKTYIKPIQNSSFMLALDGIQDPGNLGAILRLADWFGIQKIICSLDTVDCFNPKVIHASMGSFLRIYVEYTDLLTFFQQCSMPVYGTFIDGDSIYAQTLHSRGILLLGNEGKGISCSLIPHITKKISIPRFGHAQSLNVATATAICLSEFFRTNK